MTERADVRPDEDDEEGGEAGQLAADESGKALLISFGQLMKTLRTRAGMDRDTFGKAIGYSGASVASFEQARRIPNGPTIDKADQVLRADGMLSTWKEQVEKAQYPVFFQGMAVLEKRAIELLTYGTLVFHGMLQTEEYMRALLTMRRPVLDEETIEQRVTARLARQDIFERWPAPYLSFVIDESVLQRPYGGRQVLRGQLEHVLLLSEKRNVEIQVMPLNREENAGFGGPFTVVTDKEGKKFLYAEAQGTGHLQTDPERATHAHARYGIIRSQALTPRESQKLIEGVLGSL